MIQSKIDEIRQQQKNKIIDPNCYQGTPGELLVEIGGRTCYDSGKFGEKNRPSKEYHEHIKFVRHTSVLAHGVITGYIDNLGLVKEWCYYYASEPGWYKNDENLITCNFRFLERAKSFPLYVWSTQDLEPIFCFLKKAYEMAPLIFDDPISDWTEYNNTVSFERIDLNPKTYLDYPEKIIYGPQNQYWVSFLIKGSRCWSHEQIRHGYESAISQRSTRFCDESDFTFVKHLLDTENCYAITPHRKNEQSWDDWLIKQIKAFYPYKQKQIYDKLIERGYDKFTARKQSRGAAARYLPNGMETEMVFSASIREWKEIFKQRISDGADAEIRELIEEVKNIILKSELIPETVKNYLEN